MSCQPRVRCPGESPKSAAYGIGFRGDTSQLEDASCTELVAGRTHRCLRSQVLTKERRYNRDVADNVIHISEAEATRNFADVLARVRAGAEVVIEWQTPCSRASSRRTEC